MEQINEFSKEIVDRFLKSKGWDPAHIDRNRRMAFTKTKEFQMYASRMSEAMEFPGDDGIKPDGSSSRVAETSKSARVIKGIYKLRREELYDHEKDKKEPATYGKAPKVSVGKKQTGDDKTDAAAVLSGGTTLTGQNRDNVMIDPVLNKPKPGTPNALSNDTNK
jgi:hypothetical protein